MSERFCVLVCGGRDYRNTAMVRRVLDEIYQRFAKRGLRIVHGAARGADTLADNWVSVSIGQGKDVTCQSYPAEWDRHPVTAGTLRNARMLMLEKPDLCVAFPGGNGTADMVWRCMVKKIKVYEVPNK